MLVPKAALDLLEASSFKAKELVTSVEFALSANPGTVGASAVPPKSPVNFNFPLVLEEASMIPAAVACWTKAVVAMLVLLSPGVCVTAIVPEGKTGVPVKVGEFLSAFASTEACKAIPAVAAWTKAVVANLVELSAAD